MKLFADVELFAKEEKGRWEMIQNKVFPLILISSVLCFVFFVLGICLGTVRGNYVGRNQGERAVRQEATEIGAAEWRCDPVTGETKFVWLNEEPA